MNRPFFLDYERVSHHKSMLSDTDRTESFRHAIEKLVKRGDVVVDLGAGTGILSFFAAMSGAKKVYAIERTGIGKVAKEIASINRFPNIVFLDQDSGTTKLKEKCDILVSECLGYFALQENMISDVIVFRKKFLNRTGKVIPESVSMFIAPVSDAGAHSEISFWDELGEKYGVDYGTLKEIAAHSTYRYEFIPSSFISKPRKICNINMLHDDEVELNENVTFVAGRSAIMHGFCGYFSAILAPKVTLDTSPGGKTHWRQQFFPCRTPMKIKKGEKIGISVKAVLHKGFVDWIWKIKVGKKEEKHDTRHGIRLKESI